MSCWAFFDDLFRTYEVVWYVPQKCTSSFLQPCYPAEQAVFFFALFSRAKASAKLVQETALSLRSCIASAGVVENINNNINMRWPKILGKIWPETKCRTIKNGRIGMGEGHRFLFSLRRGAMCLPGKEKERATKKWKIPHSSPTPFKNLPSLRIRAGPALPRLRIFFHFLSFFFFSLFRVYEMRTIFGRGKKREVPHPRFCWGGQNARN